MPAARLLKSMQRLGSAPRLSARARKVRINYAPLYRPPPEPVVGLNGPESEIFHALVDLKVNFTAQASFLGGDFIGGARADFLLHDVRKVLLFDGPFHDTAYGRARDTLTDITYRSLGYEPVHMHPADLYNLKPYLLGIMGRPA